MSFGNRVVKFQLMVKFFSWLLTDKKMSFARSALKSSQWINFFGFTKFGEFRFIYRFCFFPSPPLPLYCFWRNRLTCIMRFLLSREIFTARWRRFYFQAGRKPISYVRLTIAKKRADYKLMSCLMSRDIHKNIIKRQLNKRPLLLMVRDEDNYCFGHDLGVAERSITFDSDSLNFLR